MKTNREKLFNILINLTNNELASVLNSVSMYVILKNKVGKDLTDALIPTNFFAEWLSEEVKDDKEEDK